MIDKTYIINLVRRPDKRKHMEEQLAKIKSQGINLNPVFFDAIDGNSPDVLSKYKFNIPNWYDPNSGKAMTNGEVGCALSHYLVWCDIVRSVEDGSLTKNCHVLILEDDVIFVDDFMNKLENYTSDLAYDMLYIHRKPLELESEIRISAHINRAKKSYWLCGYMLTYSGAKKLANDCYLNNLIPADEYLPIMYGCEVSGFEKLFAELEKLNCFAVMPSLLKLTYNAFMESETFNSLPFEENSKYYHFTDANASKSFTLLYIGPCEGQSYQRFVNYCKIYALPLVIIKNDDGKSTNLRLLSQELNQWANDQLGNTLMLIISVNSIEQCNVLPIAPPNEIVEKYLAITKNNNSIVTFDNVHHKKDLFCAWGRKIAELLTEKNDMIDQNFITINSLANRDDIIPDSYQLFQSLVGGTSIIFNQKKSKIINPDTKTTPCLFLASDPTSIMMLNRIENYTGNGWNEYYGYCAFRTIMPTLPKIYLSFNLGHNKNILNILDTVDYPKELLTVCINQISKNNVNNRISYHSEEELYQQDIVKFLDSGCDYYLFINNNCVLKNPNVIKELLELNKSVIAPFVRRGMETWTNFWGDLDDQGYYKRSFDYFDIINNKKRGCWNVPYITGVYLIKREIIAAIPELFSDRMDIDIDMRMCYHFRENDVFMYLSNLSDYGYMEDVAYPQTEISPNEITLYDLLVTEKKAAWEKKYLHPLFYQNKNNLEKLDYTELCYGIYNFPLFSQDFCTELIKTAESYGKWSKGKDEHHDPRHGKNYYENVPTVDVQLFEIGLNKQWHEIVFSYIAPVARILYSNYKTKDINLAFVVKYHFEDQKALAPHHDSSTFTVNIALNRGNGIDYNGGGCRFIKQDYILKNQDPGMCCIHPGRLTAYHEGLPVTAGTRYIMVSFIN